MKRFLNLFIIMGSILFLTACSNSNNSNNYIDSEKFINITEKNNDLSDVTDNEYLIYYYAVTCAHCANFKPTVKDYLKKDNALNIYAYNLDNEGLHDSARKVIERFGFSVEGTPTLAYIKDGKLVDILVGEHELNDIFVKGSYKKYDNVK